ncbi:9144_t:CDS:1, partial [Gigaspora rosea]
MSSKFLTFLTILVLFLSALGSSAEILRREDDHCQTTSTVDLTITGTATSGCTLTIIAPTVTAIACGDCSGPGSDESEEHSKRQFNKREDDKCMTTTTSGYTTTVDSIPGCTVTYEAPEVTAVACGSC